MEKWLLVQVSYENVVYYEAFWSGNSALFENEKELNESYAM